MQILIVEDELLIAEMLKEILEDLGHKIIAIAGDYIEALNTLHVNKPDLIFIDINLGKGKSGLDLAQLINDQHKIPFLFLTSFSDKETISKAMQLHPQAYLMKPFNEIDIFTTLELIAMRNKITSTDTHFIVKDGIEKIRLNLNDVLYFKANNVYVEIKTTGKTHLIRTSISKLIEEIDISDMFRVHRAYAVNINKIQAIAIDYVMVNNEKIPLSRLQRSELHTKIGN
jgi:DNA-binding LytR/AlgR family response regulator